MGSTVFANKKCVATTTSGHIAHSTEPDMRLENNKRPPKPFKNYLPTTKLAAKKSQITEFGAGKIWIEPTELGPPSEPVDTWPGANNGGIKNGKIFAQEGAGSKNVYVEGHKVLCHTHKTWQNDRNSQGIIDDRAGFDEYMKQVYEWVPPLPPVDPTPEGAKVKGETDTSGQEDEGEAETTEEEGGGTDEKADCSLTAVMATHDSRKQRGGGADKKSVIEVVPGEDIAEPYGESGASLTIEKWVSPKGGSSKQIRLEATFTGSCAEHPRWTSDGKELGKGTKSITVPVDRARVGAVTTIGAWKQAFGIRPVTKVVVCEGHAGSFDRQIDVYPPGEQSSINLAYQGIVPEFQKFQNLAEDRIRRLMFGKLGITFELSILHITAGLGVGWRNGTDWKVYCEGIVTVGGLLLEFNFRKVWNVLEWPILPVPAQLTISVLNAVWERWRGAPLVTAGPYAQLSCAWTVEYSAIRRYYPSAGKARWHGVEGAGGAAINIDVGVGIFIDTDLFKMEARIRATWNLENYGFANYDAIGIGFRGNRMALAGQLVITWNFSKLLAGKGGFWERARALAHNTLGLLVELEGEKSWELDLGTLQTLDFRIQRVLS